MKFKDNLVRFTNFRIENTYDFLHYVFGGCDISLSIAIDFTKSNGEKSSPESLHYTGKDGEHFENNQFFQALSSVGNIL
jgi:hypothetical protein